MASVLRPLAITMSTLPVGQSSPGHTAGFAFEMFYIMTNAVPWQKPVWTILCERTGLLADRCADLAKADGAPQAVRDAAESAGAAAAKMAARRAAISE